jgi:large subunit ribosomal protein L29
VKIEEVKTKTDSELAYELDRMKKELFELRFKSRTAGNSNPARIRDLRRTIARVHTVRHERVRQENRQEKKAAARSRKP